MIFKGDPLGSPSKTTQWWYGDTLTKMRIGMHKNHMENINDFPTSSVCMYACAWEVSDDNCWQLIINLLSAIAAWTFKANCESFQIVFTS